MGTAMEAVRERTGEAGDGKRGGGALSGKLVFLGIAGTFVALFAFAMFALVALRGTYVPWLEAHRAAEGTWQYDLVQALGVAVAFGTVTYTWFVTRGAHRWFLLVAETLLLLTYHSEVRTLIAKYVVLS